jgi:hypothetical protein
LVVAGFIIKPAWGLLMAAAVLFASVVLGRAFALGQSRESGPDSVLPPIGQRPLPGQILRAFTDLDEEDL